MQSFFILLATVVTFALAQNSLSDIDVKQEANKAINKFKGATGVTLPPELDEQIKSFDAGQVVSVLKEKCSQVSGSDAAYEEAEQAGTKAFECIQGIIDFNTIGDEIEKAKPNGNLDTVFNKYCDRRNEGVQCVEEFTNSLEPCLTDEEKGQKVVLVNMTKSLLEFVCHENGNQIALFIAEEGPECFSSKKEALENCFNKTMSKYTKGEVPSIDNLPTLVIKEEHCEDIHKLEVCIVSELETCKETTPANLVEALFRFVKKETPCKSYKPPMSVKDSAVVNSVSIVSMTLSIALVRFLSA